jgi:hypothetical protein
VPLSTKNASTKKALIPHTQVNYQQYTSSKRVSPDNTGTHFRQGQEDGGDNNQKIMNLMKRRTSEEKTSQKLGRSSDQQMRASY